MTFCEPRSSPAYCVKLRGLSLAPEARCRNCPQCRCGPPRPQPQPLGFAMQVGASGAVPPAVAEAKIENFFDSFVEPQCGHAVPFQSVERIRSSLSFAHCSQ